MTLRSRLTLVVAGLVTSVLVVAGFVAYLTTAANARAQVDASLRREAAALAAGAPAAPGTTGSPTDGQFVDADGRTTPISPDSLTLPMVGRAQAVAAGREGPFFTDVRLADHHLRLYVTSAGADRAIVLAQPLDGVDDLLARLQRVLVLVIGAGVLLAALASWFVARTALGPVRRLQEAAREVATTVEANRFVPIEGGHELADLAASFNDMLVALRRSLAAQSQLVADASHELRTPLTSLRANVDYLLNDPALAEQAPVLRDVASELEDLSGLVSDLVELARLEATTDPPSDVRLDEIVAEAVTRAQRRWPEVTFESRLQPTVVLAVPAQVERAVANVVDNAAAWTAPGTPVEIDVGGGEVVVRDHGPGIPAADLPRVFERFYRSPGALRRPGSGLGLAIVHQVATASGGSVTAERPADGGTRIRLQLRVPPGAPAGATPP